MGILPVGGMDGLVSGLLHIFDKWLIRLIFMIDDMPKYWQPLGKRFTGKGIGDLRGVRLEDINGDVRYPLRHAISHLLTVHIRDEMTGCG
jgi:hypothetical protein